MKSKLGIAVLSFAHGHAHTYCQVMRHFPDVELVSCWDADPARGQAAAQAYGMVYCHQVEQVLDDPRVEAVIVTSETNRHAGLVEKAAAAGKAILCQKPLATTLADCDRIIQAVNQSGVKFSMAYQMRHDPVNQKIKELLQAGAVGKVAYIRRRHSLNVLFNPDFGRGATAWHIDPEANVGMFFDDASHAADWFYWMLGQPRSVTAEIDRIVADRSPDDNGVALFRFQNGEIGVLENSSTTHAAISTTEIYGSEGVILQDYGDQPSAATPRPADAVPLRLIRQGDKQWTEFALGIPSNQGERIKNVPRPFVDYVLGRTDQTIRAEDGKVVIEMLIGAYRSAAEGRRITLPILL